MTLEKSLILFHIVNAILGLLSGAMAMLFRKGSGRHGAAGTVFFVSMVCMTASGAYIAAFLRPILLNVVAATLTFYLVTTAWWAARRRQGGTGAFDVGGLVFISLVAVLALVAGIKSAGNPDQRMLAVPCFIFGVGALVCVVGDVRLLRRGGMSNPQRIVRHLLRMCFALLIATFSFYPGQAKLFPMWLRATNLLWVPHILLIGSMIFHTVRVRGRRKAKREEAPMPAVRQALSS